MWEEPYLCPVPREPPHHLLCFCSLLYSLYFIFPVILFALLALRLFSSHLPPLVLFGSLGAEVLGLVDSWGPAAQPLLIMAAKKIVCHTSTSCICSHLVGPFSLVKLLSRVPSAAHTLPRLPSSHAPCFLAESSFLFPDPRGLWRNFAQ